LHVSRQQVAITMQIEKYMKTEKEKAPATISPYGKKTYRIQTAIARRKVAMPQYQKEDIYTDDKAQSVQQKK